jgi:hypothetical protein
MPRTASPAVIGGDRRCAEGVRMAEQGTDAGTRGAVLVALGANKATLGRGWPWRRGS